jgi:hypothetical protein
LLRRIMLLAIDVLHDDLMISPKNARTSSDSP